MREKEIPRLADSYANVEHENNISSNLWLWLVDSRARCWGKTKRWKRRVTEGELTPWWVRDEGGLVDGVAAPLETSLHILIHIQYNIYVYISVYKSIEAGEEDSRLQE